MCGPPVGRGQRDGLSTGKNIHETREWIMRTRRCRSQGADLPGAGEGQGRSGDFLGVYRDTVIEQCEQASTT